MLTLDDDPWPMAAIEVVQTAGRRLRRRFSRDARPANRADINAAIGCNDAHSLEVMRTGFDRVRPGVGWVEDELAGGALPPGEWWVVDPVEGAINHVHGLTDWCVSATLVRDNRPVLAIVYLPLTDETYVAAEGGGAWLDGGPLRVSAKHDLAAAIVGTGQAAPGESRTTHRQLADSVAAMLDAALVVRVSVPATWLLIQVAAGRMDAFWQWSQVRSGLLAGALLVQEAGGTISDTRGAPWTLASDDFLAAAPDLHAVAVRVLATSD